jgi:hypothetical protein
MLVWFWPVVIGLAAAAVQYGRPNGIAWLAAALRAGAVAALIGLWLDAPVGHTARLRPFGALDVSASWLRGGDTSGYRTALTELSRSGADSVFLVGDSLRRGSAPDHPQDVRTAIGPAVERALAAGRPLVLITDGEVDDPDALAELPSGSRVIVVPHGTRPDGALEMVDAPRAAVAGDTIDVRVTVLGGAGGAPAGTVTATIGAKPTPHPATATVEALPARGERTVALRLVIPEGEGPQVLRAVWNAAGDADAHNDTLGVALDVSPAAGAVFVSTSPDEDARYDLSVLRGALALPTRGFYRVALGQWRTDGTLAAVPESEVRRAVAGAPVVVLQGDTTIFGNPVGATRGALALLVPPTAPTGDEWYATGAPASPIAGALAGVSWDSLPPIDVPATTPRGPADAWHGLEVKRGRRFDQRFAVVGGLINSRRIVVVDAGGLWRWRFRGGASGDAYAALWGSIFDWLAAERRDTRPAVPADALVREGDPVRWRRGIGADSVVPVVLVRRGGGPAARPDSVFVRFGPTNATAETPSLSAGTYEIRTAKGTSLLIVNASREWLPRAPAVRSGQVGGVTLAGAVPHLRSIPWVYLGLVLALCAEWLCRRRVGLR